MQPTYSQLRPAIRPAIQPRDGPAGPSGRPTPQGTAGPAVWPPSGWPGQAGRSLNIGRPAPATEYITAAHCESRAARRGRRGLSWRTTGFSGKIAEINCAAAMCQSCVYAFDDMAFDANFDGSRRCWRVVLCSPTAAVLHDRLLVSAAAAK